METLAYLHCASAYDESPQLEVPSESNEILLDGLHLKKFSSRVLLYLLPFAIVFGVLGTATQAQAGLSYGDRGYKVVKLQKRLKTLGYFPYYVRSTGYFGSITAHSVIEFQRDKGLYEDGVVGRRTKKALGFYRKRHHKHHHHKHYRVRRVKHHGHHYRHHYTRSVSYRCYRYHA